MTGLVGSQVLKLQKPMQRVTNRDYSPRRLQLVVMMHLRRADGRIAAVVLMSWLLVLFDMPHHILPSFWPSSSACSHFDLVLPFCLCFWVLWFEIYFQGDSIVRDQQHTSFERVVESKIVSLNNR